MKSIIIERESTSQEITRQLSNHPHIPIRWVKKLIVQFHYLPDDKEAQKLIQETLKTSPHWIIIASPRVYLNEATPPSFNSLMPKSSDVESVTLKEFRYAYEFKEFCQSFKKFQKLKKLTIHIKSARFYDQPQVELSNIIFEFKNTLANKVLNIELIRTNNDGTELAPEFREINEIGLKHERFIKLITDSTYLSADERVKQIAEFLKPKQLENKYIDFCVHNSTNIPLDILFKVFIYCDKKQQKVLLDNLVEGSPQRLIFNFLNHHKMLNKHTLAKIKKFLQVKQELSLELDGDNMYRLALEEAKKEALSIVTRSGDKIEAILNKYPIIAEQLYARLLSIHQDLIKLINLTQLNNINISSFFKQVLDDITKSVEANEKRTDGLATLKKTISEQVEWLEDNISSEEQLPPDKKIIIDLHVQILFINDLLPFSGTVLGPRFATNSTHDLYLEQTS